MDKKHFKQLTFLFIAVLLCSFLVSCGFVSNVIKELNFRKDQPSDFKRYEEYLRGLNEDQADVYDGYGYTAFSDTCYVQDDLCIRLGGTTNALGEPDGLTYFITVVLVIPNGGKEAHYAFRLSRENADNSKTDIVSADGTLLPSVYQGKLPAFSNYEDLENRDDSQKAHYHDMATQEMNRLLDAAAILLSRADLTLASLGFSYEPKPAETNQSVFYTAFPDRNLCLSPSHSFRVGEICHSYGGYS